MDQQQQDSQQQQSGGGLWTAGIFFVVLAFLFIVHGGYVQEWEWTGLTTPKYRTFWDWMKLLIVPAVIAAGGLWFNRQQQERQREDDRRQQKRGLNIESQRAQDEALQAYLDKMTDLLVVHQLGKRRLLNRKLQGDPVRTVAWARTKTVLRRLDGDRKGAVLRFLNEAELIRKGRPVIGRLSGADLRRAKLAESNLEDAALKGVVLRKAVLRAANLRNADLGRSEEPQRATDLTDAYLSGADLSGADLSGADLVQAFLSGAHLSGADLSNANLRKANLSGAEGITNEELEQQAASLEGATMPNGQKYEDWLTDREGRTEDGKNDGSS